MNITSQTDAPPTVLIDMQTAESLFAFGCLDIEFWDQLVEALVKYSPSEYDTESYLLNLVPYHEGMTSKVDLPELANRIQTIETLVSNTYPHKKKILNFLAGLLHAYL